MTLNGVMAVILRYSTEFGSSRGQLRQSNEDGPTLSAPKLYSKNPSY